MIKIKLQEMIKFKLHLLFVIFLLFTIGCDQQKAANTETTKTMELLVGTYTDKESEGIYRFNFNTTTGSLDNGELLVKTPNPSYLTSSKDGRFIYAVNEEEKGSVSAFKWNEEKTLLELINQESTNGMHPCYLDLNSSEDILVVANYSSGTVTAFNVNENGGINARPQVIQHRGSGPNSERQAGPHAHCSIFNGDRWVYVVDLGIDQIIAYPAKSGALGDPHVAFQLEAEDGPRHLIFHPTEPLAFVINELSNAVVSMKVDANNGQFEVIDRVSTLPDNFTGHSQSADIQISPDGKFLYASNRGHESIAIISVSDEGSLERIGTESVRGEWPRNFVITPAGDYLLVANQYTNNIVVFKVDKENGLLSYAGHEVIIDSPVCLKF